MAAGTVNDVAGYAPAGYRLERTDYEGGAAHHRFVCEGKPELVCTVVAHEDERSVLEKFQAGHAPKLEGRAANDPGDGGLAAMGLSEQRRAAYQNAGQTAPKPAKRRG